MKSARAMWAEGVYQQEIKFMKKTKILTPSYVRIISPDMLYTFAELSLIFNIIECFN